MLRQGLGVWCVCVAALVSLAATAMSQETLIPDIPESQEQSPLANLWRQALRDQKDANGALLRSNEPPPKTYMNPDPFEVINWVPMDSGHPLYISENAPLLREIILDYLVQEEVNPEDTRMSDPNGLQVTNLNGKTLTFKRDDAGIITVEGVTAQDSEILRDGTVNYNLSQSLFDHRDRVHQAWKDMPKSSGPSPFGPPPFPNVPAPQP